MSPGAGADPAGASRAHLLGRVAVVGERVRRAVERRRAVDADPDDAFRGLYVSDADVDRLLAGEERTISLDDGAALAVDVEAEADRSEDGGGVLRLRTLGRAFGLWGLDLDLLVVALVPDLDPRFERLYGYLHDDVTRRRASVALALELAGASPLDPVARDRLAPGSPLVAGGLVRLEDDDRPLLTRGLRVPDRVTAWLLGSDAPDAELAGYAPPSLPTLASAATEALARGINAAPGLVYLREERAASARVLAVSALASLGVGAVVVELDRLPPEDEPGRLAALAHREARLRGAGIVAGPVDALSSPRAVRAFSDLDGLVVLTGSTAWDPGWGGRVPLVADAPATHAADLDPLWRAALGDAAPPGLDPVAETLTFRLNPEQVVRAAQAARLEAAHAGTAVGGAELRSGARQQNALRLDRLARRIQPHAGWIDLVLPAEPMRQLGELASRARFRERVLHEWGMKGAANQGGGITALFAGYSGTGKTLAAEVLAGELGQDLYTIDLATVVDKYIGETEKNLDRIFTEAENVNGVLFFDEADALFGKRSDVSDARDRYANVEVAYLLQRMEAFDGIAILATNLRANLDEAFTRRLTALVDFPMPDDAQREIMWRKHLRAGVPVSDEVDLGFCARAFELSGGNIRNITLTAAFLAAERGGAVDMTDVIRAVQVEYRKLGRLLVDTEFGPYHHLVATAPSRRG